MTRLRHLSAAILSVATGLPPKPAAPTVKFGIDAATAPIIVVAAEITFSTPEAVCSVVPIISAVLAIDWPLLKSYFAWLRSSASPNASRLALRLLHLPVQHLVAVLQQLQRVVCCSSVECARVALLDGCLQRDP